MAWYKVFSSEEEAKAMIPLRSAKKIQAGNHLICLVHTSLGFKAIQDDCPHREASFSKGIVTEFNEVVCPWHGYRFSLMDGKETSNNRCQDAQIFEVKVNEKGLFLQVPD